MGTLIQTPLNGRERHCINGADGPLNKHEYATSYPLDKTEIETFCLQIA